MNRVCIGFKDYKTLDAGSKAKQDAENIIVNHLSYTLFSLSCKGQNFHISHLHPFLELYNLPRFKKIKNSIVFIQQPFSIAALNFSFPFISQNNKTIVLSHDIDFLRWEDTTNKNKLVRKLNNAACIIAHNKKYAAALNDAGINVPIICLELFDYLVDEPDKLKSKKFKKTVSFIGNLNKSDFITEWISEPHRYNIELIGKWSNAPSKSQTKYEYKGVFSPQELPHKIGGAFGLVWDGISTKTCDGALGHYLRYNCPHKTSLYLASYMPIFVWKESAIADFVTTNKIGFVIRSLDEIDDILAAMTDEKYQELVRNIEPIQYKITHGEYLKTAMEKAEDCILGECNSFCGHSLSARSEEGK